ncbi:MAG TPA: fumarylacetoacetate hydrolase family protein [Candidatus Deferrimicrobiaceae bacterium]|nr:fumarylacetoacetate hydrolase family protein [Candidatus Deferrimicrobiaceae bacterium]
MTAALVEHLLKGRVGRALASPISEVAPDLTLEQAYRLQRQLEEALVGRGERVVGYKVGFTSAALQERHGVTEPVLGFLLASGVFGSGDAVPLSRFVAIGVEVEVAFLLKSDLAGPGVSTASALLAVEGAMPSFELIDFRLGGTPRGVDVVADGVYTNAIVLGRPLTPVAGLDLALEGVVFEQDGQIVATQTAAEVLGNPLVSLAWAANTLGRMGRRLRVGDIVLTGSISKILRPTVGQSVRASFTRLGSVGCRFA